MATLKEVIGLLASARKEKNNAQRLAAHFDARHSPKMDAKDTLATKENLAEITAGLTARLRKIHNMLMMLAVLDGIIMVAVIGLFLK